MLLEFLAYYLLFPRLSAMSIRPQEYILLPSAVALVAPVREHNDVLDVALTAQSVIATDAASGLVMYAQNPDEIRSIASITKLMTALVFIESGVSMDGRARMTPADRHEGNIQYFNIGEEIMIGDIFKSSLIASDNEAAHILARLAAPRVGDFVAAMNRHAEGLGMRRTHFVDPTGLDTGNVSTARDLVILLDAISRIPQITEAVTTRRHVISVTGTDEKPRDVTVYNTDRLLQSGYLHVIGGKTGYLPEAGYCLAAKVKNANEREEYIVVLGSATIEDRFQDLKAIDYFLSRVYK